MTLTIWQGLRGPYPPLVAPLPQGVGHYATLVIVPNNRTYGIRFAGRHHGQISRRVALRSAFGSSVGVELEERVRRWRENDTGDQGRVSEKETPHRPSGTHRRPVRFGQRFVHAHGSGTKMFF